MSLIPFILDLADELHEFSRCLASGIEINDFGFGLYPGSDLLQPQPASQQQQQQAASQQQSPRRSRTSSFSSSFWMPSKRHHPYNRIKSACCGKSLCDEGATVTVGVSGGAGGDKDVSPTGTPGKTASYSVVNKNGFQVSMNVKQFAPNELSVKTIDNCIVVEGRHDDKEDGHGVISRHFVRKYMLPKGYDPKDVLSTLSSDGILTVKAPPPPPPIAKNDERNERIVEIQPAPGPAQTVPVVVSAKETPVKEQTKKVLSPAARMECQLPEKRQKLDLPQEREQEATEAQTSPPPQPQPDPQPSSAPTPTPSTPTAAAAAAAAAVDENEKKEEKTAENDDKPQRDSVAVDATPAAEDDAEMESKTTADQVDEKQLEPKEAMEIDETDKTTEEKPLPETNGDTSVETTENSPATDEPVAESCTNSAPTKTTDDEVPAAESANNDEGKAPKDDDSKMEVDEVVSESKTEVDAAAEDENNGKRENNDKEGDGKAKAKATDNTANNVTTNNCTPAKKADSEKKDEGKTTAGEPPADKANSVATTKPAESATTDGDIETETAVLPPEAKNDIDDVALLKAAVTADAAEITAAEENALLSEPMDGIATTDSPAAVDKVECSLFAKKHLGNGNSNSATLVVATEEVAN